MKYQMTKIALADDHVLLRTALASLIDSFDNCRVIQQAGDGNELIEQIKQGCRPDVVILDLNMPHKDGYEAAVWLKDNHPNVHVMMLTMYDSESALIRLLQVGVKGFLKKRYSSVRVKICHPVGCSIRLLLLAHHLRQTRKSFSIKW